MKIVGVNGSLSNDSSTYKGVQAVLETAKENGAEVTLFDLRKNPLPIYHPDQSDVFVDENVSQLRTLLEHADGIVLGSPEYHGGISGVFKNAMDWMDATQFKNKPVALVAAAGGPTAMNTLNSMQVMVRTLYGWVVPVLGSIPGGTQFHPDGLFLEATMQKRFEKIGLELVEIAELLKRRNNQEK